MREFFLAVAGTIILAMLVHWSTPRAQVISWEDSPYNWSNSVDNWNNSPANWSNNASNWNNSQYNYNSPNGVYDNQGNRQGYVVPSPTGTVNYYDNYGNRQGYVPEFRRSR